MRILYLQIPPQLVATFGEACLAITPKVYCLHEAIFLDISVTEKLFGGETQLLRTTKNLLKSFQFKSEIKQVVTDRPEWAKAFAMASEIILPKGRSRSALLELPIERLAYCGDPTRLHEEWKERIQIIDFMKRVGMQNIFDFTNLPITAVDRRFGKLGVLLHQWCEGTRELHLPSLIPSEKITEFLDAEEILSIESLLFCLKSTFTRIECRLFGRRLQARAIKFIFNLESRQSFDKVLTLSEPVFEAKSFLKIIQEFFRDLHWESPLNSLEVEVIDTEPLVMGQLSLFDQTENRMGELSKYIIRLRSRFGEDAVGFAELRESHLPERSWKTAWPLHQGELTNEEIKTNAKNRPLFLYCPPRQCKILPNCQLVPSENIACEWWEKDSGYRRYFIALTHQGERLWVYWDINQREWFLHGTFD